MKAILKRDFSNNSYWIYPPRFHDLSGVYFSFYSAGYEEIGAAYFLKRSDFYCNMLTYVSSGSGKLVYNNKRYSFSKGQCILINCMKEHTLYPDSEGMCIYFFHIESLLLNSFSDYLIKKNDNPIIDINNDNNFISNIEKLMGLLKEKEVDQLKTSTLMYEILVQLRNHIDVDIETSSIYFPDIIKQTIRYMKENYHEEIDLNTISKHVGLSKYYLEKIFKKHTNSTVYEYLSLIRLKKAQELLFNSNDSIEEIAYKVGLKDSQSLIRLFKKILNETPFQYRRKREH